MYLDFYNLKDKPFRITCDPRYLWLCEKHKEALAMLRYGILDNRGFLLLTGEVGTGKTLVINQLLTQLPVDSVVASLSDPDLSPIDFYRMLGDGLKLSSPIDSKAEFLIQLREYLHETSVQKKSVALIVDEAQRLDHQLMEEIRSLSNIELPDRKLINIFLVGQPELNQVLSQEKNRALSQRITLRYHIEPLAQDEVAGYIYHRLEVAGSSEKIFKDTAIDKIFEYTAGIPRLINILCDHALLTGSVANMPQLDADIIVHCAQELRIPTQQKSISNFRYTSKSLNPGTNSAASHRATPEKRVRTKDGVGDKVLEYRKKSHGLLKWAPLGIILLIAIALMPELSNMTNKSADRGHRDILEEGQGKAPGALDSSINVNKEKTSVSRDSYSPDGTAGKDVGRTTSPDKTGEQEQKRFSEKAQAPTRPESSNFENIPGAAMNQPRELEGQQKEEITSQLGQPPQIIKSSPGEIGDESDNENLSNYNMDK